MAMILFAPKPHPSFFLRPFTHCSPHATTSLNHRRINMSSSSMDTSGSGSGSGSSKTGAEEKKE
jgi:hypothetical protein